jgi:hypothetical protein
MLKKTSSCILFFFIVFQSNAQFFDGFGVFLGGTSSRHRYVNTSSFDAVFLTHTIPAPSHKSKELFYFSVGAFKEFLSYKHFKWQTEFAYCRKGAVEKILIDMPTTENTATNKYTNLEWNNFIKLIGNEGYRGIPYLMLGIRLDYNVKRSLAAYYPISNLVPKIMATPDIGIGYEFINYGNWRLFSEGHYNPDVKKIKSANIIFSQRMWELRIGLIGRIDKSEKCNTPKYNGSYY